MSEPRLRVISLGAGVQSTTMALMAAHGEIGPMPDCAIFADTQWEPAAVYRHLDWLEKQLPFPVYRVSRGNLKDAALHYFTPIPFYAASPDSLGVVIGRRQCTYQYKLRPIYRLIRDTLGGTPKGGCELWIGISTDEAMRIKPARVQYIANRWPLIERRISRGDCFEWMRRHNYPSPPRSSCLGCPFKSDREWRDLRDGPSDEWIDTLTIDAGLRNGRKKQFMHRSCKPLGEVDLSTAEDRGQLNLFINECEGLCGN